MGSSSSCSVEIQISNKTQNITLKNRRTFFACGHCCMPLWPALSPGSRDTCCFSGDPQIWAWAGTTSVRGILVYEAESFTLAIYFYNPSDYKSSVELGLELSPGKAHLGDLEATYSRMANGSYYSSCQDIKFARVIAGQNHGPAQLSHGPVKVMATMSYDTSSTLQVVLEEQRGYGRKPGERSPIQGDRSRRSENLWDLLREPEGCPGSARTA